MLEHIDIEHGWSSTSNGSAFLTNNYDLNIFQYSPSSLINTFRSKYVLWDRDIAQAVLGHIDVEYRHRMVQRSPLIAALS